MEDFLESGQVLLLIFFQ